MDNSKSIGMLRRGQPEQDYVFSIFFLSISYTVSKVKHHPYIILKMYMLKNVLQKHNQCEIFFHPHISVYC